MINKVKDYFKDEDYSVLITNNKLYIDKYKEISLVSNNKISIKTYSCNIDITGENLIINKLLDNEAMIIGNIKDISFSE